jgi:hypothetical protein
MNIANMKFELEDLKKLLGEILDGKTCPCVDVKSTVIKFLDRFFKLGPPILSELGANIEGDIEKDAIKICEQESAKSDYQNEGFCRTIEVINNCSDSEFNNELKEAWKPVLWKGVILSSALPIIFVELLRGILKNCHENKNEPYYGMNLKKFCCLLFEAAKVALVWKLPSYLVSIWGSAGYAAFSLMFLGVKYTADFLKYICNCDTVTV